MKKTVVFVQAVFVAAFVACGGHGEPDLYPMDDEIRLNQIQVKGTHNSYKVATDYCPPEWCLTMPPIYDQLDLHGARTVELDVHYNADGTLDVYHLALLDPLSTCGKFTECLSQVKAWSDDNPGHLPIMVMVEPKDEYDDESLKFTNRLNVIDDEILSVFDRSEIITPDDVRGDHATLREAIETEGWPTLRKCRDKVMFMMLDSDIHRTGYLNLHPNLAGATIFTRNGEGESWSSILEMSEATTPEREAALLAAVQANYLVRTTIDEPRTTVAAFELVAEATLRTGTQIINTDHPTENTVPEQEGGAFRFDIPEGNPARCNPINAPAGCTPEILENLQ